MSLGDIVFDGEDLHFSLPSGETRKLTATGFINSFRSNEHFAYLVHLIHSISVPDQESIKVHVPDAYAPIFERGIDRTIWYDFGPDLEDWPFLFSSMLTMDYRGAADSSWGYIDSEGEKIGGSRKWHKEPNTFVHYSIDPLPDMIRGHAAFRLARSRLEFQPGDSMLFHNQHSRTLHQLGMRPDGKLQGCGVSGVYFQDISGENRLPEGASLCQGYGCFANFYWYNLAASLADLKELEFFPSKGNQRPFLDMLAEKTSAIPILTGAQTAFRIMHLSQGGFEVSEEMAGADELMQAVLGCGGGLINPYQNTADMYRLGNTKQLFCSVGLEPKQFYVYNGGYLTDGRMFGHW